MKKTKDYAPMEAGGFDLSDVFAYGEEVSRKVSDRSVIGVAELIERNGGKFHYIGYSQFAAHMDIFDKLIYVHAKDKFDVILPLYALGNEQCYMMAHELGHYTLHSGKWKCYAGMGGKSTIEKEANCFALGFLMPSDEFKSAYTKYKGDINRLSIHFDVPHRAVKSRVKSLSLQEK
ncbi:MAG: ImmA/IrrE family metallo-endopeptidase [Planctomycetaceae bacterium]|nr:ImmA/IrrE family metallo-endopeptidase [Planctomycetaceae bacterium]